jgi:hypothetical protein
LLLAGRWIVGAFLLVCPWMFAASQTAESAKLLTGVTAKAPDNVPRVPGLSNLLQGFNAGISTFGVYNSSAGWYSVATPAISFTFSPHYSADASATLYMHRTVQTFNPQNPQNGFSQIRNIDAGDTFLGFHAGYSPKYFQESLHAYVTLPSGNSSEGLGTGRVTFDFTNRVERYYKRLGMFLDLGAGDSSTLSNNIMTKNYSSLGALAHFQTGSIFWLKGNYIELFAYEQLPIGSQKIYASGSQITSVPFTANVTRASEDNGLTLVGGMPLTSNITALSYYNHSLRLHSDTASFGLTYVLRGSLSGKWLSKIDRALREAETGNQP